MKLRSRWLQVPMYFLTDIFLFRIVYYWFQIKTVPVTSTCKPLDLKFIIFKVDFCIKNLQTLQTQIWSWLAQVLNHFLNHPIVLDTFTTKLGRHRWKTTKRKTDAVKSYLICIDIGNSVENEKQIIFIQEMNKKVVQLASRRFNRHHTILSGFPLSQKACFWITLFIHKSFLQASLKFFFS